jgi:hypothetical protein
MQAYWLNSKNLSGSAYLARLNLENRALRWAVIVVCQIIVRLRNLWKDPGSIRKLLTADLYTNFRNSIRF